MNCVLLSAVRNEGPDLLEWIAWHRLIGFGRIVIYSNDCTDGSDALLDALAGIGWITHHRHTRRPDLAPQDAVAVLAMADPEVRGAEWLLWLDADEFLQVNLGAGRLGDLVAQIGAADAIALNWRNFGDSGHTFSPAGLVLETFTMAAARGHRMQRTVKTLFRMRADLAGLFVHRPLWGPAEVTVLAGDGAPLDAAFVRGSKKNARPEEMVPKERCSYRLAQINHYPLKALDRVALKQQRGRGLATGKGKGRFGLHYLKRFNHNDEADLQIAPHLPALRAMIAEALADPEVRRAHEACHARTMAALAEVAAVAAQLAQDRTGATADAEAEAEAEE